VAPSNSPQMAAITAYRKADLVMALSQRRPRISSAPLI
jgi:hypothetical protein